jgi:hypothetical protein
MMPKLHYYELTVPKDAPFGWARVVIGPGYLMAVSDYAHLAANWGRQPEGDDFRRHFAKPGGISPDYFCEKTGQGRRYFDAEATVAHVRRQILEYRRQGYYGAEFARSEWGLIARMDAGDIQAEGWLAETQIGDAYEDLVYDYPPGVRAFAENVLPVLAEAVAAELAAERPVNG